MKYIKFIGRDKELDLISNLKNSFFLVVRGRRRIGKTMLLRKALKDGIYIFIWPDKSIEWISQEISKEYNIPEFKNFKDILIYLIEKNKTIIIDEFQNFQNIDKSIYGEIQKIIDDCKSSQKDFKIAVAGSSYSLMNKVFNNVASPLYGRKTQEIELSHLSIESLTKEIGFSFEDSIKLWSVFEGVPYYYELIDNKISAEENIKNLLLNRDSQLKDEGKAILSIEFGKDSKTYNTILSAISEGKTKLNEISSLFSDKKNEVIKYLEILRKDFNLVRKITPITEDPRKSREGKYEIIDNFLSFWFYFIDKLRNYIEQERFSEVEKNFEDNFNAFIGKKFEKFIINLIKEKKVLSDFDFLKIGRQWGKIPNADKDKSQYEIDLVALNSEKKEILFGECKWQDKVDAGEIAKELAEKAKYVEWPNKDEKEKRKEYFAVFAKTFSKKITEFEGKKIYCFDLKDIEKILR